MNIRDETMDQEVVELVSILDNNGMRQAAQNIRNTLEYIDSMQSKLDEMINQVDEMRKELKYYGDLQNRTLGEKIKDSATKTKDKMIETVKNQLDKASERLNTIKESLAEAKNRFMNGVRETLTAIKTRGKQGLNSLIGITHIRQAFSFMKKEIDAGIKETNETIDRLEVLGNELRFAKEMKRNAFRTFMGKDTKEYEHEKDSLFSIITSAPWKVQKANYEDITSLLGKGIEKMEKLAVEVAKIDKVKAASRGEGVDEFIGAANSHDTGVLEFQSAVAEQKHEYHYNDEAFEDYMKKSGTDEKKPVTQTPEIQEKKPVKK